MADRIDGFVWDAGNEAKCERHGLTRSAIEAFFLAGPLVAPDMAHSVVESVLLPLAGYRRGRKARAGPRSSPSRSGRPAACG